MAYFGTFVLPF